jgi:hypothetical protein
MEKAKMFTAAANAREVVAVPLENPNTELPWRFPWLSACSAVPAHPAVPLGDEFAVFEEESREWAELTQSAGLEWWPDDWSDPQA